MKKLIMALALIAFASNAYAAVSITDAQTTSIGGSPFSPSQNVTIEVDSNATTYSATSCHLNGTKEYATAGGAVAVGVDASTIFSDDMEDSQKDATAGVCDPTDFTAGASVPTNFE